jgi:type IV pilus assembly protein PilM
MAKKASVWGIEIGQSALKALRCRQDGDSVIAEAFDYVEYPKILSQPEAEPEVMVREALQTLVSRNNFKHCKVAVSVAGQNGLPKFFKPPPVELKKIPDIVKYEAKQQIPFDLKDVIWDYQLMAGGDINDGFALESEVGLFAMKRDAVYRALKPLQAADIEVDLLQLAPLSLYNMVTYDRMLATEDKTYDAENPPRSIVVLAMGTDATDLIVTNGYRVWLRSMPLGGNHFTRQLTKDLKLTFAKAEHLKRNAMEADDPKLVFQAMRPVFNDLVTEVQRSMGFFRSLNKKAEIGSILMMGNSVKLPGLSQYLSKNLAMDVQVLDKFERLSGDEVISAQAFKDHLPAFGPVYGMCLQLLGEGPIHTNLVPKDVVKERLIRSKKPWALATSAALMLGFATNLLPASGRWKNIHPDKWGQAVKSAESTKSSSDSKISDDTAQKNQVELLQTIGKEVSGNADRKLLSLEIVSAIYQSFGHSPNPVPQPSPLELPYNKRTDLHITKVDSKYFSDINTYLTDRIKALYEEDKKSRENALGLLKEEAGDGEGGDAATGDEAADTAAADTTTTDTTTAEGETSNAGWVIQINGYHYHNGQEYIADADEQEDFVLKTLIQRLETGSVKLPVREIAEDGTVQIVEKEFTFKEMGISNPFVLRGTYDKDHKIANPEWQIKYGKQGMAGGDGGYGGGGGGKMGGMGMGMGMGGGMGSGATTMVKEDPDCPMHFPAPKYDFVVQMVWQEKPLTARLEAQKKAAEAAAAKEAEGAEGTEGTKPAEAAPTDDSVAASP